MSFWVHTLLRSGCWILFFPNWLPWMGESKQLLFPFFILHSWSYSQAQRKLISTNLECQGLAVNGFQPCDPEIAEQEISCTSCLLLSCHQNQHWGAFLGQAEREWSKKLTFQWGQTLGAQYFPNSCMHTSVTPLPFQVQLYAAGSWKHRKFEKGNFSFLLALRCPGALRWAIIFHV